MSLGCVFLVEDDAALRASIEDLLSFEGYVVSAWPDPQSFLEALPDQAHPIPHNSIVISYPSAPDLRRH